MTLKQAVQSHYRQRRLTKEKMAILKQVQESIQERTLVLPGKPKRIHHSIWMGTALVAAAVLLFLPLGWDRLDSKWVQNEIMSELVYHHSKDMGLEIQTASLESVKKHLSRLDFQLIQSTFIPDSEWTVLGGRYCSIKGKLAALIQVRNNENGMICSLYQCKLPKGIDPDEPPVEKFLDGIKVKIWCEKGLLLALVGADTTLVSSALKNSGPHKSI
jgi:hypothetical protein